MQVTNLFMEIKNRGNLIVGILVAIIILLLIIVLYGFIVKPRINGFVVDKQIEAQEIIIAGILNQVDTQGYVELRYYNESIILVPYVAPQQNSFQEIE